MKTLVKTCSRAVACALTLALTSVSLHSCQALNAFGMSAPHQTRANGSLQFQVRWPAFKTQALAENTHQLVVGVYQGAFSGTPRYFILEAGQERALFEQLAVGQTRVFCLAFSADNTLINGDTEMATVEANQRKPVILDLQASPFDSLPPEEAEALQQWVLQLFPAPMTSPSPIAAPVNSGPSPLPAEPTPTPQGTPSALLSPTPSASPMPTPSASPETGSRGGFSGGGSSSGPTPTPSPTTIDTGGQTGGTLQSDISIDDGAPRPDTVVIQ